MCKIINIYNTYEVNVGTGEMAHPLKGRLTTKNVKLMWFHNTQ